MADLIFTSQGYQDLLSLLKGRIRTAQVRAAAAVNQELVLLYWGIGKEIRARQKEAGWGTGGDREVVERPSLRIPRGLTGRINFASITCKIDLVPQSLRGTSTPVGISEFRHLENLPEQLKGTLPTIEEIEAELGRPKESSSEISG